MSPYCQIVRDNIIKDNIVKDNIVKDDIGKDDIGRDDIVRDNMEMNFIKDVNSDRFTICPQHRQAAI